MVVAVVVIVDVKISKCRSVGKRGGEVLGFETQAWKG